MYGKRKSRAALESGSDAPSRKAKTVHNQPWFPPEAAPEPSGNTTKKSKKPLKKTEGKTEKTETSSQKKPKLKTHENQVFVGGVGELTEERLTEHFSQFGPLKSVTVVKDQTSGKSRGFGFVAFAEVGGMEKALKMNHVIDDMPVECRIPAPKASSSTPEVSAAWECFVGGLPKSVDATALQNYFRRYGEVLSGRIMIDAVSQQSRGFGFVEFASKENISTVLGATHTIEGSVVSTKIAEQKKPKQGSPVATSNAVFLGGLPKVVPEQELRDLCGQFGPVNDVLVKLDSVTGNCRGFAFVSFAKRKGFSKCLEAAKNGAVSFQGRLLSARAAHSKSSKDSYYAKGEKKQGDQKKQQGDAQAGE
jgi:RNA recognition motif-containing protein